MTDLLPSKKRKQKILSTLLRALVSVGIFVFLFTQIDLDELWQTLLHFSVTLLVGLPIVFAVNVLLSAYKWKILLENLGIKASLGRLFLVYFISFFWGNFLPTTIGGDGYRFLEMRTSYPGMEKEVISSILLDRVYGYVVLLGLNFTFAIVYARVVLANNALLWSEVALLVAVSIGIVAWTQRRLLGRLLATRWVALENIFDKVERIITLSKRQTAYTVGWALITSLLFILISGWVWGIYYAAAGADIDWFFVLYVSTLSSIVGMLPISINGLGLVELVQVVAMSTQGISTETVIIAALSARAMALLLSSVGGLFYVMDLWRSKRSMDP